MNYDMKQSGERIQQLRIQHGYTQETLAKELNIDRSNLSRIESGRRGCSLDLFVQLSELFNVSLDRLVLGQEKGEPSTENAKRQLRECIEQAIAQLESLKEML